MKSFLKWLLVLIILVIAVILSIHLAKNEIADNTKENIKTQMLQVQAKAKVMYEKYIIDESNGLRGEKIEDNSLEEKYGVTDSSKYYKWTEEILKEEGLIDSKINDEQYFFVNYETSEVICPAGIKAKDGTVYYKLSDIMKLENKDGEEIQKEVTDEMKEGEKGNDGEGDSEAE